MSDPGVLESDLETLTPVDIEVFLAIGIAGKVSHIQMENLSMLFEMVSGRDSTFTRGYSDDVNDAASRLESMGLIENDIEGCRMTPYGMELMARADSRFDKDSEAYRDMANIVTAVRELTAGDVDILAYRFYPEAASDPAYIDHARDLIAKTSVDGIPLKDYRREDFERKLREGIPLTNLRMCVPHSLHI